MAEIVLAVQIHALLASVIAKLALKLNALHAFQVMVLAEDHASNAVVLVHHVLVIA